MRPGAAAAHCSDLMWFEGTGSLGGRAPPGQEQAVAVCQPAERTGLPGPCQRVGGRFVEGRAVSCGKLAEVMKSLGARACGDRRAAALEKRETASPTAASGGCTDAGSCRAPCSPRRRASGSRRQTHRRDRRYRSERSDRLRRNRRSVARAWPIARLHSGRCDQTSGSI